MRFVSPALWDVRIGAHLSRRLRHLSPLSPWQLSGYARPASALAGNKDAPPAAPEELQSSPRSIFIQPEATNHKLLAPSAASLGSYENLSTDPYRLARETDFSQDSATLPSDSPLLVDRPENIGSFELWSCLLNYQQRINGNDGVYKIWQALSRRKSLYRVDTPLAREFWQTILESALQYDDPAFLDHVCMYAEWMRRAYGARWPDIYRTVVSYFLQTRQSEKAIQWHIRLVSNFYPGLGDFAVMLQRFMEDEDLNTNPARDTLSTLETIYISSPEKGLYDMLIPYCYALGKAKTARHWRKLCLRHGDEPLLLSPARPFLRYLHAYWGETETVPFSPREIEAIMAPDEFEDSPTPEISREYVNRIHGGTFGISVKSFSDPLGAKWFASSWIPLDTAISMVAALGVQEIGPLSLQSIALRERAPNEILRRLAQIRHMGIKISASRYTKTIEVFAERGEEDLLVDLLQSDIHPDVFENIELQDRLLATTSASEDWRTCRLLLSMRLIDGHELTQAAANRFLQHLWAMREEEGVLMTLDDMRASKVSLDLDFGSVVFRGLIRDVALHLEKWRGRSGVDFYLAICTRFRSMDIPVPADCWKRLLLNLGRAGRIDDMEALAYELVKYYTSSCLSVPGFMPVFQHDLPDPMRKSLEVVPSLWGFYIPSDTPRSLPAHPLRLIFDEPLVNSIVRWSFQEALLRGDRSASFIVGKKQYPSDFSFARGVRLMRLLRDLGLIFNRLALRKAFILRLGDMFAPGDNESSKHRRLKANNTRSLAQMKALCDEAWGKELLPSVQELEGVLQNKANAQTRRTIAVDGKSRVAVSNRENWKRPGRRSYDTRKA